MRLAALLPAVGPVQAVHAHGAAQRAVEHAAVGGRPLEAQLGGDGEDLVGNRTFRGPQPRRRRAERAARMYSRASASWRRASSG